jgi:hypothetical protein
VINSVARIRDGFAKVLDAFATDSGKFAQVCASRIRASSRKFATGLRGYRIRDGFAKHRKVRAEYHGSEPSLHRFAQVYASSRRIRDGFSQARTSSQGFAPDITQFHDANGNRASVRLHVTRPGDETESSHAPVATHVPQGAGQALKGCKPYTRASRRAMHCVLQLYVLQPYKNINNMNATDAQLDRHYAYSVYSEQARRCGARHGARWRGGVFILHLHFGVASCSTASSTSRCIQRACCS